MKIKTLNQKSKIALLAVILVALIGLVLSVGSIVHAQEATQEEGTAPATETTQPADATQATDTTQASDATETAAQSTDTAQSAGASQQATTHNDANSLLDSSNLDKQTNDTANVYFEHDAGIIASLPDGWDHITPETGSEKCFKNVKLGTPIASVYSDWKAENFSSSVFFIGFSCDNSNVLVQGDTKINLNAPVLTEKTLVIKDNEGNFIQGATVTSEFRMSEKVTTLTDTVTGPNGECKIKFCSANEWQTNILATNYLSKALKDYDFGPEQQKEVSLDKISSGKHILKLTTYSPCFAFDTSKRGQNEFEFDANVKIKMAYHDYYGYVVQFSEDVNDVAFPRIYMSDLPDGRNYFLEDADGGIKPLSLGDEVTISGDGYNIICLGTNNSQNQMLLKEGNITYSIKHTLGDTVISDQTGLSSYWPQIDRNIDFVVEGNKLVGTCEEQNDVTAEDRYEITADAKAGYKFDNWIINGATVNDDAVLSLTENQGAIVGAATSEARETEHLLTINYKHEDGSEAATTYSKKYEEGETYSVESPTIEGYTPDIATVEGAMGTEDITTDVTYKANGGGGGDVPGGGGTSSDSAVTGGTSSSSTGDFNSSAVMAIMGLVALAGGFAIAGRKKLFNR